MPEAITVDLLRRRAEHNDGQLSNLQELSLHQSDLAALSKQLGWSCPRLKILLLQGNMISKLEYLNRLKDVRYLNVAVNNLDTIEGLAEMEFLSKLDLTMNYIDDLLSVESLRANEHLRELHLVGNPCSRIPGYREFVAATLPQLATLDGHPVTDDERAAGRALLPTLRDELERQRPGPGARERDREIRSAKYISEHSLLATTGEDPAERTRQSREARLRARAQRAEPSFRANGDVFQRNEPGAPFAFDDTGAASLRLELRLGKFLDTSLVDVDLHPTWIAVFVKHRAIFLNLPDEVKVSSAKAERSQASGMLAITMERLCRRGDAEKKPETAVPDTASAVRGSKSVVSTAFPSEFVNKRAAATATKVDIRNIVRQSGRTAGEEPAPRPDQNNAPTGDVPPTAKTDESSDEDGDDLPPLEDF
jgi:dynein axonemal assembly factor 11